VLRTQYPCKKFVLYTSNKLLQSYRYGVLGGKTCGTIHGCMSLHLAVIDMRRIKHDPAFLLSLTFILIFNVGECRGAAILNYESLLLCMIVLLSSWESTTWCHWAGGVKPSTHACKRAIYDQLMSCNCTPCMPNVKASIHIFLSYKVIWELNRGRVIDRGLNSVLNCCSFIFCSWNSSWRVVVTTTLNNSETSVSGGPKCLRMHL